MQLCSPEVDGLLSAVESMSSLIDLDEAPDLILSALSTLIRNELISFDLFSSEFSYVKTLWHNNPGFLTLDRQKSFSKAMHGNALENPVYRELLIGRRREALQVTDFLSARAFEQTDVYKKVLRYLPANNVLAVSFDLDSETIAICSLYRNGKFAESERELLSRIAPHVANFVKNLFYYKDLSDNLQRMERVLDLRCGGVLTLGSDSRVVHLSKGARRLIEEYFAVEVTAGKPMPQTLLDWLTSDSNGFGNRSPELLRRSAKQTSMNSVLRAVSVTNSAVNDRTYVLQEKNPLNSAAALAALGLTNRESEILYFVGLGKTDSTIGELLGISTRTVQKHVESLRHKLNAETRSSAVNRAAGMLGMD